jgi:hypothetical protein
MVRHHDDKGFGPPVESCQCLLEPLISNDVRSAGSKRSELLTHPKLELLVPLRCCPAHFGVRGPGVLTIIARI